jgi:hypothetical protein
LGESWVLSWAARAIRVGGCFHGSVLFTMLQWQNPYMGLPYGDCLALIETLSRILSRLDTESCRVVWSHSFQLYSSHSYRLPLLFFFTETKRVGTISKRI